MPAFATSLLDACLTHAGIEVLDRFFSDYQGREFQVRFWDGRTWGDTHHPRFTIVLNNRNALRSLLISPTEFSLGAAYVRGDFEIDGELESALDLAQYLTSRELKDSFVTEDLADADTIETNVPRSRLSGALHSRDRDRNAVCYHYEQPEEFYKLWLDPRMTYSCAYFKSPDDDLEKAQEQKLEYICRKLRLQPGEKLLDLGCGWGSLVIYAASHFGVRADGVTVSSKQAGFANKQIRAEGLKQACTVTVRDYRDVDGPEIYDKIVSVGMFEHVGRELLPTYFRHAWEMLKRGGVFLNHGIAYSATFKRRGASFIDAYVFPDGDLVPINQSLHAAEQSGFEVRDVESLREHYELTLRHWRNRLEAQRDSARTLVDEATYRTWRLYLAGSEFGFKTGRINVYQSLFAKPLHGATLLPLTREDWYRSGR